MANERVLIAEDNVALEGRPLEIILKKQGYRVVGIAKTEEDAVKMAKRSRPGVVLMDIELLDANGEKDRLAGLRAARRIREEIGSQVIFVTGILAEPDVLSEARKLPDGQFLVKPVKKEQLLASVQLAFARVKRTSTKSSKKKDLVFVSYSRKDAKFANEMMQHLELLSGISCWIDRQIEPSQEWRKEIERALREAKAAVCLVSTSFLKSKFISTVELPTLKAASARGLRVYPVYVHFVHEVILESSGLFEFQGINQPSEPIDKWPPAKRNQECWGTLCKWLTSGFGSDST